MNFHSVYRFYSCYSAAYLVKEYHRSTETDTIQKAVEMAVSGIRYC